jgi:RNA polymerase primary sigma factor
MRAGKQFLKSWFDRGKAKGMLTYKEVMDAFDEIDLELNR